MISFKLADLRKGYQNRTLTPDQVIAESMNRSARLHDSVWIHQLDQKEVSGYLEELANKDIEACPLWGIPFAIKDNIDLAGVPTTAACPEFSYTPDRSATVVQLLIDAGAIPIGKTNMDQFATGLVGTRSPYGVVANAVDPRYISGGSSSGSAVAVAQEAVSFALGTDTAGSGRVPAAFNGIIGFKPTRGWWSTYGSVPACQTLDCVSLFTRNVEDVRKVSHVVGHFDPLDSFSRRIEFYGFDRRNTRFGYWDPSELPWFGNQIYQELYEKIVDQLPSNSREIDSEPFLSAGRLLYEGPWVAERLTVAGPLLQEQPNALHTTTRSVLESGQSQSAVQFFQAQYQLVDLRRKVEKLLQDVDVLVVPTAPGHWTIDEVGRDPLTTNSRLGMFTNFVNLLDLCGIAIPAGSTPEGLPFGVTLLARAGQDHALMDVASIWLSEQTDSPIYPSTGEQLFAVCGAHMTGQPLNSQLTELGGWLFRTTKTSANYRLFELPDGKRPALLLDETQSKGAPIELEIWSLPNKSLGRFINQVQPPLACGQISLIDGSCVLGCVGGANALEGATEITQYGGWRSFKKSR